MTGQTGRAGNSNSRPVRPVSETAKTGCTQTDRKQSFKRQILSKRSPNPTKLGGKLRTYPVNISTRDLTLKIFIAREFRDEIKRGGVFSRTQKFQFVRTRDSSGIGTRLDRLESSQRVHQTTNRRIDSSKHKTPQRRKNQVQKTQREGEDEKLSTHG